LIIVIAIEKIEGCLVSANPDPLRSKGRIRKKPNKEPAQSTIVWWRTEKISDKGASIPDTLPIVLVVQGAGGQIVDCLKGMQEPVLVRAQNDEAELE
jgi:hypothetical protein